MKIFPSCGQAELFKAQESRSSVNWVFGLVNMKSSIKILEQLLDFMSNFWATFWDILSLFFKNLEHHVYTPKFLSCSHHKQIQFPKLFTKLKFQLMAKVSKALFP